jgi:glycosyltransferase involved in cell wall biosynthesis
MRLLVTSIYFPPRLGGIESHVYYLARGLARRGHEVEVVTLRIPAEAPAREEPEPGLRVRRVPAGGPDMAGWIAGGAAMVPAALSRARWAEAVHAHTFQTAPAAAAAALRGRAPLLLTLHSSHYLRLAAKPLWRPALAAALKPARLLLGTSEEICHVTRRLVPGRPVREVVNGVDLELFRRVEPSLPRRAGEIVLLAARRLVEKNGVEFLVRAAPLIRRELPVRVFLVGDGPLRGRLEALRDELGARDYVEFLGALPNRDLPGYFSSADAVVMPSLVEATSVAALEAMACEAAVAASRTGGLPEIVSEENGILFEPGDPEDMARRVVELLRAPDLAARGRRGRELVAQRWSLDRLVEEHEAMFRLMRTGLRGGHLARALVEELA